MAYKISNNCISCDACAAECQEEAISEGDGKIEKRIDSGTCADTCPGGAPAQE